MSNKFGNRRDPKIRSVTLVCDVHGCTEHRMYVSGSSAAPRCVLCAREASHASYAARAGEPSGRHIRDEPEPVYDICDRCFLTRPCGCDD